MWKEPLTPLNPKRDGVFLRLARSLAVSDSLEIVIKAFVCWLDWRYSPTQASTTITAQADQALRIITLSSGFFDNISENWSREFPVNINAVTI